MKKRIISIALVLVMMVSLISTVAYAETGSMKLEVQSATAAATAGKEVSVTINLTENTGYVSGAMSVSWDKTALALKKVAYTALAPDAGNEYIAILGDVDKSSVVNIYDVSSIQKGLAGAHGYVDYTTVDKNSLDFKIANADGNSVVNIFDASLIQKYLAGDNKGKGYGIGFPMVNNGSYKMRVGDALADDNFTGTGKFLALTFVVLEGAAPGSYEVGITNPDFLETDISKPDLAVTTVPGTITLT